mmetsp:Transcript_2666/g.3997  ORF Transcript_2666/g.3997 Transcript_2666/m.3997 type:complete len:348 (+) Transcript_2666:124-1167(+)
MIPNYVGVVDAVNSTREQSVQSVESLVSRYLVDPGVRGYRSPIELAQSQQKFVLIVFVSAIEDYEETARVFDQQKITCPSVALFRECSRRQLAHACSALPRNFYFGSFPLRADYLEHVLLTEERRLAKSSLFSSWPFTVEQYRTDKKLHDMKQARKLSEVALQSLTPNVKPSESAASDNSEPAAKRTRKTEPQVLVVGVDGGDRSVKLLHCDDLVARMLFQNGEFRTISLRDTFADAPLFPKKESKSSESAANEKNSGSRPSSPDSCHDTLEKFFEAIECGTRVKDIKLRLYNFRRDCVLCSVSVLPVQIEVRNFIGSQAYISMGRKLIDGSDGKPIVPSAVVLLEL